MPNWCTTHIKIQSDDKEKLKSLFSSIKEWTSKDYTENGFGEVWLGNIVGFSGIDEWVIDKNGFGKFKNETSCRGTLDYLDMNDDDGIEIQTETAWSPALKMWVKICDKYLGKDNWDITYWAEEPGCGIFATNDPAIAGTYDLDVWDDDPNGRFTTDDGGHELSEEDCLKFLQKIYGTDCSDVDALIERLQNDETIEDVSVNRWEEMSIYDWN